MQPTRSDVHVSRPLSNISIAYIQDQKYFICDKVFPNLPVMKQADRYYVYTKAYWQKTAAALRADATESAGGGFAIDNTPTYFCDNYAFHMDIGDQLRTNADAPIDLDRDATNFVTRQMLLRRELVFQSTYLATGVWTGNAGGGDFTPAITWDSANSTPITDIDKLKSNILSQTGFMPNKLVLANDVFNAVKDNASVLDRIKYTQRGLVTEELLASLFGVDEVLVANAVNDPSAKGATPAPAFITQNKFLLCYANPTPSILQPTAGYVFSWQGLYGAGAMGNRISTFRMPHLKADRVEGEMAFNCKLVGPDLGVLGTSVLTTP